MGLKKVKTYNGLKYLLNREIKRGRLLDVNRVPRRIGKSTLLYKMAIDNEYFIVTPTQMVKNYFINEFEGKFYLSAQEVLNLRGERFKGLLLEEGIKLEDEKQIRKLFNVVGGYSSNFKKKGNKKIC